MKRDMDLIRRITLETEARPYGRDLTGLDDVEDERFVMHVVWMMEAGLIDATAQAGSGSMAKYALVHRLTWEGCEFADAVRNNTLWAKAKKEVIKEGASFTFDLLKGWIKTEIAQGFPTLRALQ